MTPSLIFMRALPAVESGPRRPRCRSSIDIALAPWPISRPKGSPAVIPSSLLVLAEHPGEHLVAEPGIEMVGFEIIAPFARRQRVEERLLEQRVRPREIEEAQLAGARRRRQRLERRRELAFPGIALRLDADPPQEFVPPDMHGDDDDVDVDAGGLELAQSLRQVVMAPCRSPLATVVLRAHGSFRRARSRSASRSPAPRPGRR